MDALTFAALVLHQPHRALSLPVNMPHSEGKPVCAQCWGFYAAVVSLKSFAHQLSFPDDHSQEKCNVCDAVLEYT